MPNGEVTWDKDAVTLFIIDLEDGAPGDATRLSRALLSKR